MAVRFIFRALKIIVVGLCLSSNLLVTGAILTKSSSMFILTDSIEEQDEEAMEHEVNNLLTFGNIDVPDIKLDPDTYLTAPELIVKYGFPCESHSVTTEDGYILTLHRIPHGKKEDASGKKRRVVFIQHGLTSSSVDWLMNDEQKVLPYMLAEAGYDVWIGNARGNSYSKLHKNLSIKSNEYWNFSFNEMGKYDIPAVINFILYKTGQPSLYYIGHSMGTTMYFVAMSKNPDLANKVKFFAGLGPAVYLSHMKSPAIYLSKFSNMEEYLFNLLGHGEFFPDPLNQLMKKYDPRICDNTVDPYEFCENFIFLIAGYDWPQLNKTRLPVILGHTPDTTSSKCLIHYFQFMKSGEFREYDYGKKSNMDIYGQIDPPNYDLSKNTVPSALFWGQNDIICDPEDVEILASKLPNLIGSFPVNYTRFNHLDFIFAKDADKLVYEPLIKLMNSY